MPIIKTWDTEASSLDQQKSWPIEIGWVDIDLNSGDFLNEKEFLLKPNKNWTDWNKQSEAIHGIKRKTLIQGGISALEAYKIITDNYNGEYVLIDSNYDIFWFLRLQEQAIKEGLKEIVKINFFDFDTYLMKIIYSKSNSVFPLLSDIEKKANDKQKHIHRALPDALHMAWKIKLTIQHC